mmetsp:Transcript_15946/g.30605  ORF Transcript_15946/g.30605 Transcript_15946/m.30605 type:complete len:225 (-) Transcript_15946:742-1416(-)
MQWSVASSTLCSTLRYFQVLSLGDAGVRHARAGEDLLRQLLLLVGLHQQTKVPHQHVETLGGVHEDAARDVLPRVQVQRNLQVVLRPKVVLLRPGHHGLPVPRLQHVLLRKQHPALVKRLIHVGQLQNQFELVRGLGAVFLLALREEPVQTRHGLRTHSSVVYGPVPHARQAAAVANRGEELGFVQRRHEVHYEQRGQPRGRRRELFGDLREIQVGADVEDLVV